MSTNRHYANAPIREGLIDIRVELPSDAKLASLDPVFLRVQSEFPKKEDRKLYEGQVTLGEKLAASTKQTQTGYLYRSRDDKRVLQARLDGFTFSRLKPYQNWPALRDEARALWDIYRGIVKPTRVTRVAVRYINRIDIPSRTIEPSDYFQTFPQVSPDITQDFGDYLMQLRFLQPDLDALLVLTQTGAPPASPESVSVILDIDLFKQGCDFQSDEEVWNLLELFRDRKNEYFENCITDKARALFGPAA